MNKKVTLSLSLFIFGLLSFAQENKSSTLNDCQWEIPEVLSKELSQGDGIQLLTSCSCDIQGFKLSVFDNWGYVVFTTNDITEPWDASEAEGDLYYITIKGKYSNGNTFDYTEKLHVVKE